MKHKLIFRILAVALTLSLLVLALPLSPVAAATLTLAPTSGSAGSLVTVTSTGLPIVDGQPAYIFFGTTYRNSALVVSAAISTSITVPIGATPGLNYVTVQSTSPVYNPTYQVALAFFTVTGITLTPTLGQVGDTVTIVGSGFTASQVVTVTFDAVAVATTPASVITNILGSFSATFTVPEGAKGSRTVRAQTLLESATATYTISPKLTVTPVTGGVGDQVTVSGTGFAASQVVTVTFDAVAVTTTPATVTTNTSGSFTATFTIPASSRGAHTVKAQDTSLNAATAIFTVGPKIALSPATGPAGITVTIVGSGFGASQTVTITYGTTAVTTTPATVTTNTSGGFSCSFTAPAGQAGTFTVSASDGIYTATASFVATFSATISEQTSASSPGHVGMSLTIEGTGFLPSTTVTVTYASDPVQFTTTTDTSGDFSITITIPASAGGAHTITVSDGTNIKPFSFFMEQEAPSAPTLLLPEVGTKAKGETVFDWQDVTDDSGVIYILQIGLASDFSVLVMPEKEVTTSGYTLTEVEKLASVSKDTPYYWRVKAIDGASNEGDWSSTGTFYVGFSLDFDEWVWYVLGGVGGLLLLALGFWLGRRSVTY